MEAEPETKVIDHESKPPKAESVSVAPLAVGKRVGRYELIHRLGHGGMAAVYLGRATGRAGFEKLVAVKVIHPHLAAESEFVEMFLDEARIAARLHHPHVVEIHDLGEADGVFFMVMEYIEGETLASLLRQLRKHEEHLPLPAVLQVIADTCEGLASAHDLTHPDGRPMHLVHRDVSPHNLLVGMDGRVKVVDFGIAKATGRRSSTRTGQLRGKLAYMSPEQAGGDPIDHRTDLFALGAVLWELLTNERLFMADTESETLARVSACEVPDLRTIRDDLSEEVVALVERALARDRDERFATAQDMLRETRVLLRSIAGDIEPRDELARVMERRFSARVDYIRAAVRRASESDPAVRAANDAISPEDATRATQRPSGEDSSGSRTSRAPTGSVSAVVPTNTHTLTASLATAPARHWSLWLLLPLVGAAVGATMVSRGSQEDVAPVEPPPVARDAADEPTQAAPAAPNMIKWHFDTDPPGAIITLDGKAYEQPTPALIELASGDKAITVLVSKEGYRPLTRHLVPLNSGNYSYQLQPQLQPTTPAEVVEPKPSKRLRPPKLRLKPKTKPTTGGETGASAGSTDPDAGDDRGLAPSPFDDPKKPKTSG